eukprot:13820566-Ditylum_brightwellii.AAC.1
MALEIPELGERTGGRRLSAIHHRTLATSSSQCRKLTCKEGQEGDGSDGDTRQQVPILRHADGLGCGKWRNEILGLQETQPGVEVCRQRKHV